ncbi:PD40 domain-containing protein [candidate division KSB1 bacterium]|nr:PD40 domain-containing protein [candidate division KSB1 bacterium]
MKRGILYFFSLAFVSVSAMSQVESFDVYTFQANAAARIGYPANWRVQEHIDETQTILSAVITKTDQSESEGFIVFFIPFPKDTEMKESKQFAGMIIEYLGNEVYAGLTLENELPHSSIPAIYVSNLSLLIEGIKYLGRSYSSFMMGEEAGLGIFVMFYAPNSTFGKFNVDEMLAGVLAPIFDANLGTQSKTAPPSVSSQSQSSVMGKIFAVNESPAGEKALVSIELPSKSMNQIIPPNNVAILSPTVSVKHSLLALPLDHISKLIISPYPDTEKEVSFVELPAANREIHFSHPTISHDGRMIAFRVKGMAVAGTIDSHDWYSGAYKGSYTAIASEVSIVGFDIKTKSLKVSYITKDMLDMGEKSPMYPAFSPVEDVIAFVTFNQLQFIQGSSAKKLNEFDLGNERPIDISGLAWSPDGKKLAYFQRKEVGGFSGRAQYYIAVLDIASRNIQNHALPDNLRPGSRGGIASAACLDFSPDGRCIVFCAETADLSSAIKEDYARLEAQSSSIATDIFIFDIQKNQTFQITQNNRTFDPVWKGR